jgi:hypothetical protein
MYSKLLRFAMPVAALLAIACSSMEQRAPWRDEPIGQETNLAFVMRKNLLYIPSVTIDGRPGAFLIGSSQPSAVLDAHFVEGAPRSHTLQLNRRQSLQFNAVSTDLHGIADAILGANVWGSGAVTLDDRTGLMTFQREGIHPELMTTFAFDAEPAITISVDGRKTTAVVDTTSPDTLVLPSTSAGRRTAHVEIAGTDFGTIDVRTGGVTTPRIGNRLLSKFLVSIDYGRRIVGLWRDPRTAL